MNTHVPGTGSQRTLTAPVIAGIYAGVLALWVGVSDPLVAALAGDTDLVGALQRLKDWCFVALTATMVYALVRRSNAQIRVSREALRRSERLLRDVNDAASDWIWETDGDLRFTYLSSRFYELTGIPPDRVLGRTRWELFALDPPPPEWRRHWETVERHLPFRDFVYEPRIPDGEGKAHFFKISGKPIHDGTGRFLGYRGTGTDITEQMLAETALQESRRTLYTLMANLPGMAYRCRTDVHRTMEFVSTGSIGLIGYRPRELVGEGAMRYATLIAAEDREAVAERIESALAQHRPFQLSYRVRTASNEEKWVWEQGRGIYSPDGELQAIEGLIIDITEEKRAAQEMARMRKYLKSIIDSMPSVLVGVDTEGRITECNHPAEVLGGVHASEAQGRFFGDVFPQLRSHWEQVRLAITRGQPIKARHNRTAPDGQIQYTDVMVYPLVVDGVVGAVLRMDDVTARVRTEAMMAQTEKMLSIGGLAAGMAHEINNPLGAILQGSQNISRRLQPELERNREVAGELGVSLDDVHRYMAERGILHFLEDIHEAGLRASRIVTDMLAFSRRGDNRGTPVDLREALETALRLAASDYDMRKRYDIQDITIERDYDPDLAPVPCEKTQIEQVLLNLVKNAAQAMAEAGTPRPTLTVRTRHERDHARIEIGDNGPGMDEATRRRVFEPFFTTKAVGTGTGLGLSVSYFIVNQQHEGTLSVSSTPGKGSTFVLRLPLKGGSQMREARTRGAA